MQILSEETASSKDLLEWTPKSTMFNKKELESKSGLKRTYCESEYILSERVHYQKKLRCEQQV